MVDIGVHTQCVDMIFQRVISGNVVTIRELAKSLNSVNKNIYGLNPQNSVVHIIQINKKNRFMVDSHSYEEAQNKLWAIQKFLSLNLPISFLALQQITNGNSDGLLKDFIDEQRQLVGSHALLRYLQEKT